MLRNKLFYEKATCKMLANFTPWSNKQYDGKLFILALQKSLVWVIFYFTKKTIKFQNSKEMSALKKFFFILFQDFGQHYK